MKINKGFTSTMVLTIVLGLLIAGGGVYYVNKNSQNVNNDPSYSIIKESESSDYQQIEQSDKLPKNKVEVSGVDKTPLKLLECKIKSFKASPFVVSVGESSTLSWVTENCNGVALSAGQILDNGWIGGEINGETLKSSGSKVIYPKSYNTSQSYVVHYSLSAVANFGDDSKAVEKKITITIDPVTAPECTIKSFKATPSSVIDTAVAKTTVVLSWETENCDIVYMDGGFYDGVAPLGELEKSGSLTLHPPLTSTYNLHASTRYNPSGPNSVDNKSLTVVVTPKEVDN